MENYQKMTEAAETLGMTHSALTYHVGLDHFPSKKDGFFRTVDVNAAKGYIEANGVYTKFSKGLKRTLKKKKATSVISMPLEARLGEGVRVEREHENDPMVAVVLVPSSQIKDVLSFLKR